MKSETILYRMIAYAEKVATIVMIWITILFQTIPC